MPIIYVGPAFPNSGQQARWLARLKFYRDRAGWAPALVLKLLALKLVVLVREYASTDEVGVPMQNILLVYEVCLHVDAMNKRQDCE
jgi:hypothetical protein